MQTIRFVGGPYHGRVLAVRAEARDTEVAVLPKLTNVFTDGTLVDPTVPLPVERVRYFRTWLERSTPTLFVREQVMLVETIRPGSTESIQRWQELRAA